MTTPAGPIQIEIVQAESPTVSIVRTPPPGVSVAGSGPRGPQGIQGPPGATGATGPAGTNGTNGTNGTDGAQWLNGTVNPTSGQGVVGDWFINTTSQDVFKKTNSTTWTLQVNIKGAPGATGATGAPGATGAQGVKGDTGAAGPNNLVIVTAGTALPTDPTELSALEGKLWVEYTP